MTAARVLVAGLQGSLLPAAGVACLKGASSLVQVLNALLARHDDLALESALKQYNAEVEEAAEASKSTGKVDVERVLAESSPFQASVRTAAAEKNRPAKAGAAPLQPDGLTLHEYVCAVPSIDLSVVGTALWHFVLAPTAGQVLGQVHVGAATAVGAAIGSLLVPGTGTSVGSILGSMAV